MSIDWYERQNELWPNQIFYIYNGSKVKLDRRVPGDGTKWYVADWDDYHEDWAYYDTVIEPGDLRERVNDLQNSK